MAQVTKSAVWVVWILLLGMFAEGMKLRGHSVRLLLLDLLIPMVFLLLLWRNFWGAWDLDSSDHFMITLAALYVAAALLSFEFNVPNFIKMAFALKTFILGFLVYLTVSSVVRSQRAVIQSTYACVFCSATIGLMLLYRFLTDWGVSGTATLQHVMEEKTEVGIDVGKSNYLAALLVLMIPVLVGLLVSRRGKQRIMLLALAAPALLGLLVTMSRGAWVSLILGLICCAPLLRVAGTRVKHILVGIVGLAIVLFLSPAELVVQNLLLLQQRLQSLDVYRLDLFKLAWSVFLKHPIFGTGLGSAHVFIRQFAIDSEQVHFHNWLLNNMAEVGLAGTVPFVLMIGAIMIRGRRACITRIRCGEEKAVAVGLFVGLVSSLIHGLIEPTFIGLYYCVIFWTVAALLNRLDRLDQAQLREVGALAPPPVSLRLSPPLRSAGPA